MTYLIFLKYNEIVEAIEVCAALGLEEYDQPFNASDCW